MHTLDAAVDGSTEVGPPCSCLVGPPSLPQLCRQVSLVQVSVLSDQGFVRRVWFSYFLLPHVELYPLRHAEVC